MARRRLADWLQTLGARAERPCLISTPAEKLAEPSKPAEIEPPGPWPGRAGSGASEEAEKLLARLPDRGDALQ